MRVLNRHRLFQSWRTQFVDRHGEMHFISSPKPGETETPEEIEAANLAYLKMIEETEYGLDQVTEHGFEIVYHSSSDSLFPGVPTWIEYQVYHEDDKHHLNIAFYQFNEVASFNFVEGKLVNSVKRTEFISHEDLGFKEGKYIGEHMLYSNDVSVRLIKHVEDEVFFLIIRRDSDILICLGDALVNEVLQTIGLEAGWGYLPSISHSFVLETLYNRNEVTKLITSETYESWKRTTHYRAKITKSRNRLNKSAISMVEPPF